MAARGLTVKDRLRRKLAEKRSSFADEFEYRLLCVMDHGFYKSPTMWEVERVAISMSNNAEQAIQARVQDGSISHTDAATFLASDTVQLHAKRWRKVSRRTRKPSEMTVQEALLDVEEMSNVRIWPDPCTLSMSCYLFSRWRPDRGNQVAATANGDVCVSVVNCPPAAERVEGAAGGRREDLEYYLVDTHAFTLHVQRDVEARVIQALREKRTEALVINSSQTTGAWIHANETTVQFNLASLMVCVPQADLMHWAQPRQTLEEVVKSKQAAYNGMVRAHLGAGGVLRPRMAMNGERVAEAVFRLDDGTEVCADPEHPGTFNRDLPRRSAWSTLEEVPGGGRRRPKLPPTAKVFSAAQAEGEGAGEAAPEAAPSPPAPTPPQPHPAGGGGEQGGGEEPSPLASIFGPSLAAQRLELSGRGGGQGGGGPGFALSHSYAASLGVDIEPGSSVRLAPGVEGAAPPSLPSEPLAPPPLPPPGPGRSGSATSAGSSGGSTGGGEASPCVGLGLSPALSFPSTGEGASLGSLQGLSGSSAFNGLGIGGGDVPLGSLADPTALGGHVAESAPPPSPHAQ